MQTAGAPSTTNIQAVISGLVSVVVEITKALQDGFQPLADAGHVWSAYQNDASFKAKVDALVNSVPRLGEDFKNFDVSQLLTLSLAIYPEVQLAVHQILMLYTKKAPEQQQQQVVAQTEREAPTAKAYPPSTPKA